MTFVGRTKVHFAVSSLKHMSLLSLSPGRKPDRLKVESAAASAFLGEDDDGKGYSVMV